jgi:hypothetical protein
MTDTRKRDTSTATAASAKRRRQLKHERMAQELVEAGWYCAAPTDLDPFTAGAEAGAEALADERTAEEAHRVCERVTRELELRLDTVAGLHELAEWLLRHPDVPTCSTTESIYPIGAYVNGGKAAEMAELRRIREIVGSDEVKLPNYRTGDYPSVSIEFGPVRYRWYTIQ